ncbi:MAG: hypothetical protein QXL64_07570 [Thermofilaceae archaeon]
MGDRLVDKFYFVRCSIIRYRYGAPVLYPLGKDKEKIKHLHGRKVYALIIAEE